MEWPVTGGGEGARDIGFVFQEPTLMPWATVTANVRLPLRLAGLDETRSAAAGDGRARTGRARGLRRGLSARAFRRHEDARLDRARARHRAEASPDGRAVRGARRDHALQAQRRSAVGLARARQDRGLRHPFGIRIGLSVEPDRGDDAAAGPRLHRARNRRALSARPALPHLGGICRLLPAGVGGAGGRHAVRGGTHERNTAATDGRPLDRVVARAAAGRRARARRADLGTGRAACERFRPTCCRARGWC